MAEFYKLSTNSGKGSMKTAIPLLNNFRTVQPLNDRKLYFADLKLKCKHRDWTKTYKCDFEYRYVSKCFVKK